MQESSNTRINMLFMLDVCLTDDSGTNPDGAAVYRELAVRDLPALIDMIVPPKSWDAVINLGSVQQILLAWRSKRVFEPCLITTLLDTIEQRAARYVVKTDFQHSWTWTGGEYVEHDASVSIRHSATNRRRPRKSTFECMPTCRSTST